MSLPPGFLEELRTRTSLSHVVGRKVMWDTRKSNQGKGDLWAPCPFHQEKTASFHVDDRKGFYYCFGCHAKGDAIAFLREAENLSFMEAVESLAQEAGMEMPRRDPGEKAREDRRAGLAEAMEAALAYYRLQLRRGPAAEARAYLERRGLDAAALERFEIGFAPPGWEGLREALTAKGFAIETLLEAGLVKASDRGRAPYDVFRDRILFPIRDGRGRAIAFGGRAMDPADKAKYLNSPETPLFDKSRTLYNLRAAREAAGKGQPLIVAEGYMDVIALAQAGFEAAVAPLGTAVTEGQLQTMWRVADEPVIALDGDAAGLRAAEKVIDRALPLLEAGKGLRFAVLPPGKDPDDLIRAEGPDGMARVLEAAVPMVELLWRRETEGRDFDSPERRAALELALQQRVAAIRDPMLRRHYDAALKDRRWQLFRGASRPARQRGAGRGFGAAAPAARASTRASALVSAAEAEAEPTRLREAAVLVALLATPAIAPEFEGALESLVCIDPEHERLRAAILAALAGGTDIERAAEGALGRDALERLRSARHLSVIPCLRRPGDPDLARRTVAEELAKLRAAHGLTEELSEAVEQIDAAADETLTWRLGQAARAKERAGRPDDDSDAEFDLGPNGAPVDRAERDSFEALLARIRFDRGKS